jgi:hypothetical protein
MESEDSWLCIWEHTTILSAQFHGPVLNCNMLLFCDEKLLLLLTFGAVKLCDHPFLIACNHL